MTARDAVKMGIKNTTNSPAAWMMPSIGDVMFICLFIWLLSIGTGMLNDGDTGWHIVTGRGIINTLSIPYSDPYSYTMPGTPWTAHEWLAEVVYASVYKAAGLNGVVVFTASVVCLTFLGLYGFITRSGVNPLVAAPFTVAAAIASSLHWLARPHVFSFPLTLAFIVIIENYQRGRSDRLKFLPLLMVLWVNLHGGFILGIMILALYAGGNIVLRLAHGPDDEEHMKKFKTLAVITGVVVLACFVNPQGPKILYFPFHLVGREYIMDNVQEWLSPNFHKNTAFEVLLFAYIMLFALSKRKPDIFEGGAALMLLHMSLYSARYIPLMALIVTPAAASRVGEVFDDIAASGRLSRLRERISKTAGNISSMDALMKGHVWAYGAVLACALIALNGGMAGHAKLMDYRHDPKRFPVDAVNFALDNDITGRMFNNDSWGGYIIFRTYPRYKVFFDGRSDMYGVDFMKQYVKVAGARRGYMDVLDKYRVDWVIYNANHPVCQLLAMSGWKLVYADTTADILLRDTPANRRLIEKYPGVRFVPDEEDDD